MDKKLAVFLIAIVLLPVVVADDGAEWFEVPIRTSWDLAMSGTCALDTQCLVHLLGNASYNGRTDKWFSATAKENPREGPKCLNTTQYINDFQCENGNWTSRTRSVALQLLQFANQNSATNFSLYCDRYDRVLNQYRYQLQGVAVESYLDQSCVVGGTSVPCVNSICVLKTPQGVAFGVPLNVPVNDPSKSFLKALAKNVGLCNSVSAATSGFAKCAATEPVWYGPSINSIIWLPSGALPAVTPGIASALANPLATMSDYVLVVLHSRTNHAMDFSYFPKTRLFNHLFVAQNGNRAVFGFLETDIRPEFDPVPVDYLGVRYTGIDLGGNPCLNLVKRYDSKAFCENQTTSGFNVIARQRCEQGEPCLLGASPIVDVFPALAGKLRP
jgi:hypothetical protein